METDTIYGGQPRLFIIAYCYANAKLSWPAQSCTVPVLLVAVTAASLILASLELYGTLAAVKVHQSQLACSELYMNKSSCDFGHN